ncbi:Crp/Fnr family transcriptional regulator, partial [Nostoc sp.]|uniref:Crp/Fnr family transcriptional regulator n=1 Tax=Nostoc sp. TaxID=1180 RepID=UPI002FFB42C7
LSNRYTLIFSPKFNIFWAVFIGFFLTFNTFGKDITSWFSFEGDFSCSFISFNNRVPSQESIVAISQCKLLAMSHNYLQYLYKKDPVWDKLGRLLIEDYYIRFRERLISFQTLTATERYNELLQRHPDIENQVQLGYIASYLGIDIATLSRLRTRRKNRQLIPSKPS